jgi:hypothetical protein
MAITAIRDVVYFHGQGIGRALLVLSVWIAAGTAAVVTLYVVRARTSSAPAPAQPVPAELVPREHYHAAPDAFPGYHLGAEACLRVVAILHDLQAGPATGAVRRIL